jgi:hypothetical protein
VTINVALPATLENATKNLHSLLSASVDATNLGIGAYNLNVKATPKAQVTVESLTPASVQVEIWEKKSKKKFN